MQSVFGSETAGAEREIELKLLVERDRLAEIFEIPQLASIDRDVPGTLDSADIASVYYDTDDFALIRRGIALRIRQKNGQTVQTIKTVDTLGGPATDRLEFNTIISGTAPALDLIENEDIRAFVAAQATAKGLRPIFETSVSRATIELRTSLGDVVEMAIDEGEIRSGTASLPISEVELELKEGRPHALYELAHTIAETGAARLGVLSKAARGYALAAGRAPRPVKAKAIKLDPEMTVEDGFCAIVSACTSQLLANEPAVIDGRNPEGLHQLRVSLRRLRAAFTVFGRQIGTETLRPFQAQAKRLANRCGDVRDLDVLDDEIFEPVCLAHPDHTGLKWLRSTLEDVRDDAWLDLLDYLKGPELTKFVLDMTMAVETRSWRNGTRSGNPPKSNAVGLDDSIETLARHCLNQRARRVLKKGHSLSDLTEEKRHELRIQVKKLRYASEFFSSLFKAKKGTAKYLKLLAQLQDSFGALNDLATAKRLIPTLLPAKGHVHPGMTEAALLIVEWHAVAADHEWRKTVRRWKRLRDTDQFWDS